MGYSHPVVCQSGMSADTHPGMTTTAKKPKTKIVVSFRAPRNMILGVPM